MQHHLAVQLSGVQIPRWVTQRDSSSLSLGFFIYNMRMGKTTNLGLWWRLNPCTKQPVPRHWSVLGNILWVTLSWLWTHTLKPTVCQTPTALGSRPPFSVKILPGLVTSSLSLRACFVGLVQLMEVATLEHPEPELQEYHCQIDT